MFPRFVACAAAVISVAAIVSADVLVVKGVVSDVSGGVEGATVRVSVNGTAINPAATTNSSGAYIVTTTSEASNFGIALVTVNVTATGYANGIGYGVVQNPGDNAADTVVVDVELVAAGGNPQGDGDSLYITGTVTNTDADPVAGAMVRVRFGGGAGGTNVTGITNASGDYSIATVNTAGRGSVTILVAAAGYTTAQEQATIANPRDGTADVIDQDFVLEPMAMDTVTVTATVLDEADDSPLSGARVILSYSSFQGMGMQSFIDTGITGAEGTASFDVLVPSLQQGVSLSWVIEADGYASEEGRRAAINDTVKIGTVRLAAMTIGQNITYTVSGRVTDQNGAGVGQAMVKVEIAQGGSAIFFDSTTTAGFLGIYEVSTQQDYAAGDITVTVSVTADGYTPASVSQTFASSTTDITLNISLLPVGTSAIWKGAAGNAAKPQAAIYLYNVNGRLLGIAGGSETSMPSAVKARGYASQPVILLRKDGGVKQMVIPGP